MEKKEINIWNSDTYFCSVTDATLLLFPSWVQHQVPPNAMATKDRISLSFNTFVRGTLGARESLTEVIIK